MLIIGGTLASCGSKKTTTNPEYPDFTWDEGSSAVVIDAPTPKEESVPVAVAKSSLNEVVEDWLGTPYRWGGTTKNGADCSGFALQIYEAVYEKTLPGRRAEDFFQSVTVISEAQAKPGDLIFFKINGRRINHVGIYLGKRRFAHASSSKGVIISSLDESYYRKYFFKIGRPF